MKRPISILVILVPSSLALAALCSCSTPPPPAELKNAQSAYQRTVSSPAAQHNRAGVIEARQALDAAEQEYADSPGSDDVKTLGYVAQRQAQTAEAQGRAVMAAEEAAAKERALAEKERELAETASRRAKVALDQLGLAAKDEARGTVFTLPSENMFATNEARILPAARGSLVEFAKGLKEALAEGHPQDVGRKIVLIGYSDDTGSDAYNLQLSERRAEAVKTFLVQQGLEADRMEIQGKGEADPVGDNTTREGRAKNRRVEIVITPARGMAPTRGEPTE